MTIATAPLGYVFTATIQLHVGRDKWMFLRAVTEHSYECLRDQLANLPATQRASDIQIRHIRTGKTETFVL